ncbi:MAG: hypothetical protein QOD99_853 [Chthoniobacter sp.]|jgi:prepilin-type N-terminal cleavage/methylation domain-containing protein|nr:hypothetical protein [Chthoniobacter sp.]
MKERRAAFTLMELLAVIAIIAVLGALIFPATRTMMRGRDKTAALGNMRQLGVALHLYSGENEFAVPGRVTSKDHKRWPALLAAYLSDVRIYAAPGLPNYLTEKQDPLSNTQNHTSFIINGFNDKGAFSDESVQIRLTQFSQLNEVILFGMQIDTSNFYMDFMEKNQDGVLKLDAYNDGSIYLFADGASRFITKAEYAAPKPGTEIRYGDWLWLADKSSAVPDPQPN